MNLLEISLQIVAIIISVILIALILLQVRGSGLGSLIGAETGGITRTRRGLERTIFQITVGLAIAFLGISIAAFAFAG